MDFNYTPEDQAFRTEVRTWLEANKKFAPPPSNIMADEGEGDWRRGSTGTRGSTRAAGWQSTGPRNTAGAAQPSCSG